MTRFDPLFVNPELEELLARYFDAARLDDPQERDRVVAELTEEYGSEIAESLLVTGPYVLHGVRRIRAGFRSRIQDVWGEAIDLFEFAWLATVETGQIFNQEMQEAGHLTYAPFEALRRTHARACLVASEVRALIEDGYPEGAWARWRTLHELSVVAWTIGDAGEEIAERYLDHAVCEALRDLTTAPHDPAVGGAEEARLRMETQELLARHGEGFNEDWGWARPLFGHRVTFRMLEERIERLALSRPHYRESSHYVHGGAGGAARSMIESVAAWSSAWGRRTAS